LIESSSPRVLVVDDDQDFSQDLEIMLPDRFSLRFAKDGGEGLAAVAEWDPDVVLLDIRLGTEPDGLEVLDRLRALDAPPQVIMLSEIRHVDTVVSAMKRGAFHYLAKPPHLPDLVNLVDQAAAAASLQLRYRTLLEDTTRAENLIIAGDPLSRALLGEVARFAGTDATVLITGESGSGKELYARHIHRLSSRADGPFIDVNCAAIPHELIESEFFGHEKGAFTNAVARRAGKFELAAGGTLFLDELGDSPLDLQTKLLRAIEERQFMRVGGTEPLTADVRVIAATSTDLEHEIEAGGFRAELYYRLNVFRIHIPPLRSRPGDILPIAEHLMLRFSAKHRCKVRGFTPDAGSALNEYGWPGNVRELRNVVERAVVLCRSERIGVEDLFHDPSTLDEHMLEYPEARQRAFDTFQKRYLCRQLSLCDGNVTRAAERSGIPRPSFQQMLKRLGIDAAVYRTPDQVPD
jgi:DNA-binding NtrC family response regulator